MKAQHRYSPPKNYAQFISLLMCVSFYTARGMEVVGVLSSACVKVLYLHLASEK